MQFEVSPLENAVETLESKNQNIKSLIDQHRSDPSLRVDNLSMLLGGVVDASVNGGISNYKVTVPPMLEVALTNIIINLCVGLLH